MDCFNFFPVCNSVALSTFTLLYNHHHRPSPELLHLPKLKLYPLNKNSSFPPSPAPGNLSSTFCLCGYDCFRQLMYSIYLAAGLFQSARCL